MIGEAGDRAPRAANGRATAHPQRVVRQGLRRLRRRVNQLVGRDVPFRAQMKCASERLGSDYGGWVVCPRLISPDSLVYSVGVGEDISFDLAMIARFGVTVQAFDPTPEALAWISRQVLPAEFVFHPLGLASFDGIGRFVRPRPDYVSYRLASDGASDGEVVEGPVHRLVTITQTLGHTRIDVLKMDIEGAEYDVIIDLCADGVPVDQLLVEFHHRVGDPPSLERTRRAVRRLMAAGYMIFSISPNGWEYSFLGPRALSKLS